MSVPLYGQEFTFTQPDGTQFRVRGYGDQHHAVFETLDGFTVTEDPTTGFYQYAALSQDSEELVPTGIRPGAANPTVAGLEAGVRISRAAARAKAMTGVGPATGLPRSPSRWETRRNSVKSALRAEMAAPGIAPAPPQRQTVGNYVGLCLLIQFPDVPGTIAREEVEAFCNQRGYTGFGNNGSVCDYFLENSLGTLHYTNIVAPYYTTAQPRAYYTNEAVPQPTRAWEMIKEAIAHHMAQGFDFSGLTSDDQSYVYALNVFYTGQRVNNWSKGLWPHAYHLQTPLQLAPGKFAYDYQITDIGQELTLGTFCHENGHMICDFPDLYDYGYESRGAGVYCLMCAGGNADPKNPGHVGAYLKRQAGWAGSVTRITDGLAVTAEAGKNQFFIHAKGRGEYYLIENRLRASRDQVLPGSGLAIWHVDETGSNNNEAGTPGSHYECALVQADGQNELEGGSNDGDPNDLFHAGTSDRFGDTTRPNSRWWNGKPSGLEIKNISAAGTTMTFSATLASG